jgi:hypothetical protein
MLFYSETFLIGLDNTGVIGTTILNVNVDALVKTFDSLAPFM